MDFHSLRFGIRMPDRGGFLIATWFVLWVLAWEWLLQFISIPKRKQMIENRKMQPNNSLHAGGIGVLLLRQGFGGQVSSASRFTSFGRACLSWTSGGATHTLKTETNHQS